MDNIKTTEELLGFLKNSPTAFQAVEEIGNLMLLKENMQIIWLSNK